MTAREQTATIGRRAWAALIDSLVLSVFVLILYYDPLMALAELARQAGLQQKPEIFLAAFQAFQTTTLPYIFALYIVYHAVLVWQGGMTLGKYLTRIRVVRAEDGGPVSLGSALVRALVRTLGEMFLMYVTFLPAWFTPLRQTLHDRLARTVVIRVARDA